MKGRMLECALLQNFTQNRFGQSTMPSQKAAPCKYGLLAACSPPGTVLLPRMTCNGLSKPDMGNPLHAVHASYAAECTPKQGGLLRLKGSSTCSGAGQQQDCRTCHMLQEPDMLHRKATPLVRISPRIHHAILQCGWQHPIDLALPQLQRTLCDISSEVEHGFTWLLFLRGTCAGALRSGVGGYVLHSLSILCRQRCRACTSREDIAAGRLSSSKLGMYVAALLQDLQGACGHSVQADHQTNNPTSFSSSSLPARLSTPVSSMLWSAL